MWVLEGEYPLNIKWIMNVKLMNVCCEMNGFFFDVLNHFLKIHRSVHPHKKINQYLTDINRCLTNISQL